MRDLTVAAALLWVACTWSTTLSAQGVARISGSVRDQGGQPLREVLLVLDPAGSSQRTETDSLGQFVIAGIPVGAHELRIMRIGYERDDRVIEVSSRGLELQIVLRRIAFLDTLPIRVTRTGIFGIVVAHENVRPLENAIVVASGRYLGVGGTVKTAKDGQFTLPSARSGGYSVTTSRAGFKSRRLSVLVPADGGVELAVALDSLTGAKADRIQEQMFNEFVRRQSWRSSSRSAMVDGHELPRHGRMSLAAALQYSPSFLVSGLVLRDSIACLFINGRGAPYGTAGDIDAADVESVEIFGMRAELSNTLMSRFAADTNRACGRGGDGVRVSASKGGLQPTGVGSQRIASDHFVRIISVWLRR